MSCYPTHLKHRILTQYQPNCRGNGFKALAHNYGIKGGGRTIKYWYDRWDGTLESLEPKPSTGRPNILSSTEIKQYIGTPIKRKNRRSEPVHYTELIDTIGEKTGKRVSLRTIQRYGREKEGIKEKRTKKRTIQERKCIQTSDA
jgi:hypothetical protein